jgi:hypothetical protein
MFRFLKIEKEKEKGKQKNTGLQLDPMVTQVTAL